MTNLTERVMVAFGPTCQRFNLPVTEINENEAAIWGNRFALLVWLDRDGVSVKYVDLANDDEFKAIDIGSFLVKKRSWIVADTIPLTDQFESRINRGLSSYARSLEDSAPDILEGKKDWIVDVTDTPIRLGVSHEHLLRERSG